MALGDRPFHVVYVVPGLGYGGNERLCLELVRHAPARVRHTIVTLDPARHGMESDFLEISGVAIDVGLNAAGGRLRLWKQMVDKLRALSPDGVLICTFGVAHLITATAAHWVGVPRLAASAGNPAPLSGGRWKWSFIVWLSWLFRVPIYSCSFAVDADLRRLGAPMPSGSRAIPNGCNVQRLAEEAASARDRRPPKAPLVIGMVARLDVIKDHATLLRAIAALDSRHDLPAFELWLVGEGDAQPALESLVSGLGLRAPVKFLGARADVPSLLGQMDVYAFSTTRNEGFGIALAEAMAAGLPVVASDVPACREVLADGAAGLLVPAADSDAMAVALRLLMVSGEERIQWSKRAEERARSEYDIRCCAARWYSYLLPKCGAAEDKACVS